DQRYVPQFVILLEWSSASDFGRWRGWQCMVSRRDIDLADDAGAVFLPADVYHCGRQKDRRKRHTVDAATRVHGCQPVGDQKNDEHADQRLDDRSLAASQGDTTKDGGR